MQDERRIEARNIAYHGPEEEVDFGVSHAEQAEDAHGEAVYQLSPEELARQVEDRVTTLATACGIRLSIEIQSDTVMSSRVANLVGLVLVNLVENALQATPAGKSVTLQLREIEGLLICTVRDQGPGFPHRLRQRLFLPVVRSQRPRHCQSMCPRVMFCPSNLRSTDRRKTHLRVWGR